VVPRESETEAAVRPIGRRRIDLPLSGGQADVDVYDALGLPVGAEVTGPAVFEHPLTTIQLPAGWRLNLDGLGNYLLTDAKEGTA
jgi:N-methylhydantoinase A